MLTLRPARADDLAGLRAIVVAAYAAYLPRMERPPAPMTTDYAAAIDRREVWVAVSEGEPVGLVVLIPRPDHLLLDNLAVRPAVQSRGIGSRLLALAEREAARLGLGKVCLYTNAAMTENLAYYPRHGYRLTRCAEEDGFQRVFFAKDLSAG